MVKSMPRKTDRASNMILGVSSLLSAFLSSEIKTEIIAQKRKEPNKITETVSELVNKCKIDQIAIPKDIGCLKNFLIKQGIFAAMRNVKEKNMTYLE